MNLRLFYKILINLAVLSMMTLNVYAKNPITKSGIEVDVKENLSLSTQYFGVLDFQFTNVTQDWIRIKQTKAYFNDQKKEENINFTSGRDLAIWAQATEHMKEVEAQKAKIFLGVIAGLGAGFAGFSSDTNIKILGTMASLGAISSLSIMEFNKRYNEVEKAKIFPDNHLFASEFIIPPGLYIKRFLVLNTKNHQKIDFITNIFLEVQTESSEPEEIELKFRRKPDNRKDAPSQWQKELIKEDDPF